MTRKSKMTDGTNNNDNAGMPDMTVLPGVSFTAHSFKGDVLCTPAAIAALASDKPANRSYPSVLQQIEMYYRIKRARGEKPF